MLLQVGPFWLVPGEARVARGVAKGAQGVRGRGDGPPCGPPEEKVFDMFENSQKPSGQHELC